jgi:uncharacterized membrane protein
VGSRTKAGEAVYRACLFVLPPALAFLWVVALLPVVSSDAWYTIVVEGMVFYLLAPVGTEIVIPYVMVRLVGYGAAPHEFVLAVVSVILVDVIMALFIAWNWDLLEQMPYVGRAVRRVEAKCHAVIARKKWGEGMTLAALAAYVALPVQMTGGLFSSVLGRVLGIDRKRVFLAVTAGSAAGAVPMAIVGYLAGDAVLRAFQSPTAQTLAVAAGILITIAFVAVVVVLYLRGKRAENPG